MKRYILVFLSLFLFSINVSALDNVYIDKVSIISKSEDVVVNDTGNISLTFNNVGETVRYKLDIINNSDLDYVIDYIDKYDYIDIKFVNTKIKKHSTNEVYLDIAYNSSIDRSINYNIDDILKVKLDSNYNKNIIIKSILIIVLLLVIIIVCSLISKIDSRRIFRIILIGFLIIPINSIANNEFLNLKLNIVINNNHLLTRCTHNNSNCINWNSFHIYKNNTSLITINNKDLSDTFVYDNTIYSIDSKFDVSNNHNRQVVLGVYNSTNKKSLLIIGQNNGVVLPENSSCLFMNTKFNVYDLNSINTIYATNMSHMFRGVKTDSIDLGGFNTNNVSNMNMMFYNSNINEVNLNNISINKLEYINYMFGNSNINKLVGYSDLDFSHVENKTGLFYHSNIKHIY